MGNSIDQSPSWEANGYSASQQIPRSLWNPAVHYRVKEPAIGPYCKSDESSPHHPTLFSFKICLNFIFTSTPRSSE